MALDQEEQGESKERGIIHNQPYLQNFEVFVSPDLRERYNGIFKSEIKKELEEQNMSEKHKKGKKKSKEGVSKKNLPKGMNNQILELRKREISNHLISYITQVKQYQDNYI